MELHSGVPFCPISQLLRLDEPSFPCEQGIAGRRWLSLTVLVCSCSPDILWWDGMMLCNLNHCCTKGVRKVDIWILSGPKVASTFHSSSAVFD